MMHARIAVGLVLAALVASPASARAQSAPEPSKAAPAASEPPHSSLTLAYALLGAGAVSLGVGAVFGILALSDKSSFDGNPTYDQADSVRNKTLVADVGLGLGVVLAGAGAAFLLLATPSASAPSGAQRESQSVAQVRVAPMVGPSRGGATLTVSFQ